MCVKLHVPFALAAILLAPSMAGARSARAQGRARRRRSPATEQAAQLPSPSSSSASSRADGELARYPKILEYFQLVAKSTDRVTFEGSGDDDGNRPAAAYQSPQNLA
jgi:hypothetical protein